MDQISLDYSSQVRTLQSAIKTQNEVLINKLTTIINQITLDSLIKLEDNLNDFLKSYQAIIQLKVETDQQAIQTIQTKYLNDQILLYSKNNLKNLREQLALSINSLQHPPSDQPQSSLQDVMQLLMRAGELYSKNLKEILNFPAAPNPDMPLQSIEATLQGQLITRDNRTAISTQQVTTIQFKQQIKLNDNQIFDIHPINGTDSILITTFENELFIYDLKLNSVIKQLEALRFAPSSALILQRLDNITNKLTISPILLLGGSEFDPNIYAYDINLGRRIQTLPGHDRSIRYLAQLGDINTVVSASRDSKIFFWNFIKAEPKQILNIPTIEIIEFQLIVVKQQIITQSIDGKIVIIQLYYNKEMRNEMQWGVFEKATIINLIEIQQTSSLSQLIILDSTIKIILFASGWLSGQNQIRIFEETPYQSSLKFQKSLEYNIDSELYQLISIKNKNNNNLLIVGVKKDDGQLIAMSYPDKQILQIQQSAPKVAVQQSQIRWNIKLSYVDSKYQVIKYGNDQFIEIYDIII